MTRPDGYVIDLRRWPLSWREVPYDAPFYRINNKIYPAPEVLVSLKKRPVDGRRLRWTSTRIQRVIALHDDGKSLKEIAKEIGHSPVGVRQLLMRLRLVTGPSRNTNTGGIDRDSVVLHLAVKISDVVSWMRDAGHQVMRGPHGYSLGGKPIGTDGLLTLANDLRLSQNFLPFKVIV